MSWDVYWRLWFEWFRACLAGLEVVIIHTGAGLIYILKHATTGIGNLAHFRPLSLNESGRRDTKDYTASVLLTNQFSVIR